MTLRGRESELLAFGVTDDPADGFLLAYCLGSGGPAGRQGSNGPKSANLSVPPGSLLYWQARLYDAHVNSVAEERFGVKRLSFAHPSGVPYTLVEADTRAPAAQAGTREETFAISGLHSVTISLTDVRETHAFLVDLLDAEHVEQDLASGYYQLGADGPPRASSSCTSRTVRQARGPMRLARRITSVLTPATRGNASSCEAACWTPGTRTCHPQSAVTCSAPCGCAPPAVL